jgi:uncharacterized protein involved in outer membrane biogenesis
VIRRIVISLAALLAGFIIVWLMLLALGVTVRLDVLRDPIEIAASEVLGREVRIDGAIEVRPTLGPTVVVRGLRIASPIGWHGIDLLQADRVEATLGLVALLRGSPCIARLLIQNVSIALQTRGDGSRNWHNDENRAATGYAPSRSLPGSEALAIWQRELQELSLRNIALSYRDDRTGQHFRFKFDEISGSTLPDQPLDLLIRGGIRQESYVAHLTGGNLSGLLAYTVNWPLQVTLNMAGTNLVLNGKMDALHPEQGPALDFDLHGVRLPVVGESMMHGRLGTSDSGLDLAIREARFGQSTLHGRVSARFDTARPHINAELQASTLDATVLSGTGSSYERDGSSLTRTEGGSPPVRSSVIPGWLGSIDIDAVITVREFVHTPVDIRNTSLKLSVRDGRLNAPLAALIADVPFHGELAVNRQDERSALELKLIATDAGTGNLVGKLTGIEGIRGKIKHIVFQAATSAIGTIDFLNGFDIGLNITGARFSYGNVANGRPVDLTLDDLALAIPAGKKMSLSAHGTLLSDAYAVDFTGGTLKQLLRQEEWPLDLSATGSGTTLGINGSLAGARGATQARLYIHLSGEHLGDLADWFGVSPCSKAPYTARGQLIISANIGRLQFLQARLGGTQLNGDLDWSVDEQLPLLHAVMHFDALDPADLDGLTPLVKSGEGDAVKKGFVIDMPILPSPVRLRNADIKLAIEHILIKPVEFTDVSLSSQIRGGRLMRSPFHAHIGTSSFQGYLDPSGAATDVIFKFEGNDKDSGNRLNELFSNAVRWAGSAAVVPLQWLLKHELSARGADNCRGSSRRSRDHTESRPVKPAASTSGLH